MASAQHTQSVPAPKPKKKRSKSPEASPRRSPKHELTGDAKTVGVRELRQNLSKYLTRVKRGEALTVTERGHEVARLVPSPNAVDPYYLRLAEKYGATIPKGDLVETIKNLPPLNEPAPAGTTDAFLEESRQGEFGPR